MGHQGFRSRTITKKRHRDKHRENGLCSNCSKQVEKGKRLCEYHLKYDRDRQREARKKNLLKRHERRKNEKEI